MGVEPDLVVGPRPTASVVRPRPELGEPTGIADWRGDVALELWVETEATPPRVRLRMAGAWTPRPRPTSTQVVAELLADGTREVELCTEGLRVVDSSALGALADVERQVRQRGGTLVRVGPTGGPFGRLRRPTPPIRS